MEGSKSVDQSEQNVINIESLREVLKKYMLDDELIAAMLFIQNFSPEIRRQISAPAMKLGEYDPGLLFFAVEIKNARFFRFLVEECNADLEEQFYRSQLTFEVDEEDDQLTPLWYAVTQCDIKAVEELIRLGANVNAVSQTSGGNILHEACFLGFLDIATVLIDNGADVMKTDNCGFTTLMGAGEDVDLCQLLIENGVDVNATNQDGDSALHLAARAGLSETVQLLLESGADIFCKNDSGDEAVHVACTALKKEVVEVLAGHLSREGFIRRQIEAHQLLGACYLAYFTNDNVERRAFNEWKVAIQIRDDNRHHLVADDCVSTPNPAYNNAVEVDSISQLNEIRQDANMMYMQSLLLQEKILGPTHKTTIWSLMRRGDVYLKNEDYGRGLRLLRRGFKFSCDRWMNKNDTFINITNYLEIHIHPNVNAVKTRLDFLDVHEFFETLTIEAKRLVDSEAISESKDEINLCFIQIVLYLIKLFPHVNKNDDQILQFKKLVHGFIRLNLRSDKNRTLLMNAICVVGAKLNGTVFLQVDVIKLLLDCGADVGQADSDGNAALHLLSEVSEKGRKDGEVKQVAEMLLSSGAHFDARNRAGFTAVSFLHDLQLDLATHMTLQCLTAQVIRRHEIPYVGILTKRLIDFVEMH